MLELNNFGMVNVIELASLSHESHKSQRFQGFMFKLIIDVHSSDSLSRFTPLFHAHIAPKVPWSHCSEGLRSASSTAKVRLVRRSPRKNEKGSNGRMMIL